MLQSICILLLLFFSFLGSVFAAPSVIIENISDSVVLGENFSVGFSVSNADIGSSFYYKVFGGIDDNTSSIQNFYNSNYLNYTSSWADFPILVISTNSANLATAFGRVNNNSSSGIYNIRLRIAKTSNTSSKYDSEIKNIDIIAPSPTPTEIPPSNTPTPNPTSTPTSTPTLSNTPTPKPTITPTPTKISSPIPTIEPSVNPEPIEEILGATDVLNEPTIIPTEAKNEVQTNNSVLKFLPTFLIVLGSLLLLTPLVLSKIKHCSKKILRK